MTSLWDNSNSSHSICLDITALPPFNLKKGLDMKHMAQKGIRQKGPRRISQRSYLFKGPSTTKVDRPEATMDIDFACKKDTK